MHTYITTLSEAGICGFVCVQLIIFVDTLALQPLIVSAFYTNHGDNNADFLGADHGTPQ